MSEVSCCTAASKVMFKSTIHRSLILYWRIIQQFKLYVGQAWACDDISCFPFISDFIILDSIYKKTNQPWRNSRSGIGLGYVLVQLLWQWSRFIMRDSHPERFKTECIRVFWEVEVNQLCCCEVKELVTVVGLVVMHSVRKGGTEAEKHLWLVLLAHKEGLLLASKSNIVLYFQHTKTG